MQQRQFSQNYNVDNRYRGNEEAVDNRSGKKISYAVLRTEKIRGL